MSTEEVNLFKTKRLLKSLRDASGNGTSMVSLILRPGESISKASHKLNEEHGTARNIKSRVNRQSVESAIVSARERLNLYSRCPVNGLCIFSGEVMSEDGKSKRMVIDFEPFKPINTTLYMCDSRFHIEALEDLLADDKTFVFIIVDGNEYMLGTLAGNTREVLDKEDVSLPSKTRRGGQSSNRFARLRDIARNEWIKRVCERLKKGLVDNGKIKSIEGIVLAGNADIKHLVQTSANLDPRIKEKIISIIDVPYGGHQGFNHAITLSQEKLGNIKFVEEKEIIGRFFDAVAKDGNVSYGVKDTFRLLEDKVVEKLLVWENLTVERWTVAVGDSTVVRLIQNGVDEDAKEDDHVLSKEPLLDWLIENIGELGAEIHFVSDRTTEGSQFCKGFGGIGSFTRYKVNLEQLEDEFLSDDE